MPEQPKDDLEDMLSQLASAHQETAEQIESMMAAPTGEVVNAVPAAPVEVAEASDVSAEDALARVAQGEPAPAAAVKSEEEIIAALASEPGAAAATQNQQGPAGDQPDAAASAAVWEEPAATERPRRRQMSPPAKQRGSSTAATGFFIPIIFLFGLLTLIPAILGTFILLGANVPLSDREDSKTMAVVMLACWPVSIGLIAGGVYYVLQYNKAKRKAAEETPRPMRGKAL